MYSAQARCLLSHQPPTSPLPRHPGDGLLEESAPGRAGREHEALVACRMLDAEPRRVQRDPPAVLELVRRPVAQVAHDGRPEPGQLHPDLVCPPRQQLHADERPPPLDGQLGTG